MTLNSRSCLPLPRAGMLACATTPGAGSAGLGKQQRLLVRMSVVCCLPIGQKRPSLPCLVQAGILQITIMLPFPVFRGPFPVFRGSLHLEVFSRRYVAMRMVDEQECRLPMELWASTDGCHGTLGVQWSQRLRRVTDTSTNPGC